MIRDPHPLARKTVRLKTAGFDGALFRVEDWWQNVSGRSWMHSVGNPACLIYAIRGAKAHLPTDNEVVYGKIGNDGVLVHATELGDPIGEETKDDETGGT